MLSGRGSLKGAAFERYIARRLSLWVSKGHRDDLLWRSAGSGARATLQLRQDILNRAQAGDLSAIAPEAYALCERCLFEIKAYKNLDLAALLAKGTGKLANFWEAAADAAKRIDKAPVLIAKQNYLPILLLTAPELDLFRVEPVAVFRRPALHIYEFEDATAMVRRRRIVSRESRNLEV